MRSWTGVLMVVPLVAFSGLQELDDRIDAKILRAAQSNQDISVPEGPPIVLDGTLDQAEWAGSAEVVFGQGGSPVGQPTEPTIRISRNGRRLQVGVDAREPGFPHIAMARGDTIRVLHASAALGSIVYTRSDDGWRRVQAPTWELRDTSMTARAMDERETYFRRTGWVATTAAMGSPGGAEFLIDLERFGPSPVPMAMAFLTLDPDGTILRWPSEATDDVAARPLLTGPMPESLDFRPNDWARLLVSDREEGGGGDPPPDLRTTSREHPSG